MDKDEAIKLVESIQQSVEQMKIDDIEESPESAYEEFVCNCCGEAKILAGSLLYGENLLCNDCVLLAETAFALGKTKNINDIIDSFEDKRFELLYNSMFNDKDKEVAENQNN